MRVPTSAGRERMGDVIKISNHLFIFNFLFTNLIYPLLKIIIKYTKTSLKERCRHQ